MNLDEKNIIYLNKSEQSFDLGFLEVNKVIELSFYLYNDTGEAKRYNI